jgi:hypothetical protein
LEKEVSLSFAQERSEPEEKDFDWKATLQPLFRNLGDLQILHRNKR